MLFRSLFALALTIAQITLGVNPSPEEDSSGYKLYVVGELRAESCLEQRLRVVLHRKLSSFRNHLAPQLRQQSKTEVDSSGYATT